MITLDCLPVNTKATISGFTNSEDPLVYKLLTMGLVQGTEVHVVREAPLKDPITIKARSYELSLRRSEAQCVRVISE